MTTSPASQLVSNVLATVLFPTTESRALEPATPVWKISCTPSSPIPQDGPSSQNNSAGRSRTPPPNRVMPETPAKKARRPVSLQGTPRPEGQQTTRVDEEFPSWLHAAAAQSGESASKGNVARRGVTPNRNGFSTLRHVAGSYSISAHQEVPAGTSVDLSAARRNVPRIEGVAFASRVPRPDAVIAYAEQTLPASVSPRPSIERAAASPRSARQVVHSRTSSNTSDVGVVRTAAGAAACGSGLNSRCTTAPPTPGMLPHASPAPPVAIPLYAFPEEGLLSSDESPKSAAGGGGDIATVGRPRIFHRHRNEVNNTTTAIQAPPPPPPAAAEVQRPLFGGPEGRGFAGPADDEEDEDDFVIQRLDSDAMGLAATGSSLEDRMPGDDYARSLGPKEDDPCYFSPAGGAVLYPLLDEMEIGERFSRQRFQFQHFIPWTEQYAYIPLHLDINGTSWLAVSTIDGLPYAVKEIPMRRVHGLANELQCLTIGNEAATDMQNRAADFIQRYYTIWKDKLARSRNHHAGGDDDGNGEDSEDVFVMQLEYYPRGNVQELWLQPSSDVADDIPASPSMLHYEMPTEEDVRCCLRQTLLALSALHHHGFVHGNPIPYNIFAAAQNHFKLGSLGSAVRIPGFIEAGDPGRPMLALGVTDENAKLLALYECCPEQYLPLIGSSYYTMGVSQSEAPSSFSHYHQQQQPQEEWPFYLSAGDIDVFILFASTAHLLLQCAEKAKFGRKKSSSSFSSSWSCFPSMDDVSSSPFGSPAALERCLAPFYSKELVHLLQRVLFFSEYRTTSSSGNGGGYFARPDGGLDAATSYTNKKKIFSTIDRLLYELDAPTRRIFQMQNVLETQITYLLERIELAKKKRREQHQEQKQQIDAISSTTGKQRSGSDDVVERDMRALMVSHDELPPTEDDGMDLYDGWTPQKAKGGKRGHETPDEEGIGPRRASSALTFEPSLQARRTEVAVADATSTQDGQGLAGSFRRRQSGLTFALPPPLVIDNLMSSSPPPAVIFTNRHDDLVGSCRGSVLGRRPSMFLSSVSTPLFGGSSPTSFPTQEAQGGGPATAGPGGIGAQQVAVPRNTFASSCANVAAVPSSFRALLESSSPVTIPSPGHRPGGVPSSVSGEDLFHTAAANSQSAWTRAALFPESPAKQQHMEPPTPLFDLSVMQHGVVTQAPTGCAASPPFSQLSSSSVGHTANTNSTLLSSTGREGDTSALLLESTAARDTGNRIFSCVSAPAALSAFAPFAVRNNDDVEKALRFGDDDEGDDDGGNVPPSPSRAKGQAENRDSGLGNISTEVMDRVDVTTRFARAGSVTLKSTVEAVEQLLRLRLGTMVAAEAAPLTATL